MITWKWLFVAVVLFVGIPMLTAQLFRLNDDPNDWHPEDWR